MNVQHRSRLSVSVAIPTYNRERVLIDTIEHVLAQNPPADEVLVIDQTEEHEPETADFFAGRLERRGIATQYVSRAYLPFRLNGQRMNQIRNAVQAPGKMNTDMRPVAFLYDIILWSTHFNSGFRSLMEHTDEGFYLFETEDPISVDTPTEEQIRLIYRGQTSSCRTRRAPGDGS